MESRCFTQTRHLVAIARRPVGSSRTLTRSVRALGRFLPTWSARIGQLAVPAVDEHGEPYGGGPAEVVHRVERGPDRAAGEEHVVDEHHDLAVDAAGRHLGLVRARGSGCLRRSSRYIVTSSLPTATATPSTAGDPLGDPAGEGHPAGGDAEQDEVVGALVALEDLVGDAGQCPGDVTGVEDDARVGHVAAARTSFSASRDGSLKDVDRRRLYLFADRARPPVRSAFQAQRSRMATTPWPPAAQIEISARPEPRSASSLAATGMIRPPVAANGCAAASEEPLTLSFSRSIEPSGRVEAETLLAEHRVLPGRERRQHLRREGLVDLVEVEVLEGQAVAGQHPRDGVRRGHQQALVRR